MKLLTILKLAVFVVVYETGGVRNIFAQDFAEISSHLLNQVQMVKSVEFTSQSEGSYLNDPSNPPPVKKSLHLQALGEKFAFEYKQSGGADTSQMLIRQAFDGNNYQIVRGNQVELLKKLPSYIPLEDDYLRPFFFVELLKEGDTSGTLDRFVSLGKLSQLSFLTDIMRAAKNVHLEKDKGDSYFVATFPGVYAGSRAEVSVWFSVQKGGYPIKWQLRDLGDSYREEYEITELGKVGIGQSVSFYPKLARFRQYRGDTAIGETAIKITSIAVNSIKDDSVFTLDLGEFETIDDLDAHKLISVPR